MTQIIRAIGRTFVVSSLLPSVIFVAINRLVFIPPLVSQPPRSALGEFLASADTTDVVIFTIVVAAFIGYGLLSLNVQLVRLFEGYYWGFLRWPGKMLHRWIRERWKNTIHDLGAAIASPETPPVKRAVLLRRQRELQAFLAERYPEERRFVMPTQLGNIFRAFESYPGKRYGLDAIVFWPRLLRVVPAEYAQLVEEANNGLAFLLSCSLFFFILAVENAITSGLAWLRSSTGPTYILIRLRQLYLFSQQLELADWHVYLWGGIAALVATWVAYRCSIPMSLMYGETVKSCFDLCRHRLLEEFGLCSPHNMTEERHLWEQISDFILLGKGDPYSWQKPSLRAELGLLRRWVEGHLVRLLRQLNSFLYGRFPLSKAELWSRMH